MQDLDAISVFQYLLIDLFPLSEKCKLRIRHLLGAELGNFAENEFSDIAALREQLNVRR